MGMRFGEDATIKAYADGFRTMLNDSLAGIAPILPNVKIPSGLTEEKTLEIYHEVLDKVGGSKCTLKELGEVLAIAHRDAWEETLQGRAELVGDYPEVYHSCLATYMRDDGFALERKKLD